MGPDRAKVWPLFYLFKAFPQHLLPAPEPICRYGPNRLNFMAYDKFLLRAASLTQWIDQGKRNGQLMETALKRHRFGPPPGVGGTWLRLIRCIRHDANYRWRLLLMKENATAAFTGLSPISSTG